MIKRMQNDFKMEGQMFSLVNKHEEFFDYLVTNAEHFHKGAVMIKELLTDPSKLERYTKEIKAIEHTADDVTHEVVNKMGEVFITPIDREDFCLLTNNIDDCVDDVKDVILSLRLYHAGIGWALPLRMADILVEMAENLIVLFRLLKNIHKNEKEINERVRKINILESEADNIYRDVVSDLFDGDHEVMEIIRWKEIMETMEITADQGERVANIIREVVVKYA